MNITDNFLIGTDSENKKRAFLKSENINIFPCSRRGQKSSTSPVEVYDPEARLNTERTNRLRAANRGFKDSFTIEPAEDDGTLKLILGGYYIEILDFDPTEADSALGDGDTIYAYLSLHTGIALGSGYTTEILYRQLPDIVTTNFLDVPFSGIDFFIGVSFTKSSDIKDTIIIKDISTGIDSEIDLPSYTLAIFKNTGSSAEPSWELVIDPTTVLGKTEVTELLAKGDISATGNITAANISATNISVENIDSVNANSITQNGKPVPAIAINQTGSTWQLQITLDASK